MPETVGCIDVPKPRVVAYPLRAGGDHRLADLRIRRTHLFLSGRGVVQLLTAQPVSFGLCVQVGAGVCHRPPYGPYRCEPVPKMDGFARSTRMASHGISVVGHRVVSSLGELSSGDARHFGFWPVAPNKHPTPVPTSCGGSSSCLS
jgi:hypothetical protein